ncbi:MAG: M28 family peptidase [Bacteroidales bacterium]
MYEDIIYTAKQKRILSFLADDCCRGRSTGSLENEMVAFYIQRKFKKYGLQEFESDSFFHPFMAKTLRAKNIIGYIPALVKSDEYVIISAHYDNIGALNGFVYNGADANASGVTALLNIADMFGSMYKAKMGPDKNIIFCAFDAKEISMAGSINFVKNLKLDKKKIICEINIDQLGSTLEPIHKGIDDYIVILGEKSLKKRDRGKIHVCNNFYNLGLDIDYTFYSSKNFTKLVYKLSDQSSFINEGIPSLLFTSGFTKHTNKTTDDINLINFEILKKRTLLIFYFVTML